MTSLSSQNDSDLLLLLKQDAQAAFDEIYNRYWSALYNTAYKRLPDRELCRDAVQNVFIDLWSRRTETTITNLSAYLHKAVRFQVFKAISKNPQLPFVSEFENVFTAPNKTENDLREKEILQLIELWVQTLPERRRQIFTLHYKEGLTTREIAEKLGISQNTVQAQLYTASESLRMRLAQILAIYIIFSVLDRH
jgi:RNA polymerase sigma-70 factor (family 1)